MVPVVPHRFLYDFMVYVKIQSCLSYRMDHVCRVYHSLPISIKQFKFIERVLVVGHAPPSSSLSAFPFSHVLSIDDRTVSANTLPALRMIKKNNKNYRADGQRKGPASEPYLLAISIPFSAHKKHRIKCYDFIFCPVSHSHCLTLFSLFFLFYFFYVLQCQILCVVRFVWTVTLGVHYIYSIGLQCFLNEPFPLHRPVLWKRLSQQMKCFLWCAQITMLHMYIYK